MEQILEHLLAKMNVMQERMDANLRAVKAEIRSNNETLEVLRGTFISWKAIHQATTEASKGGGGGNGRQPKENESQPRTPERRNNGQPENPDRLSRLPS
jgi:hypothetical protein